MREEFETWAESRGQALRRQGEGYAAERTGMAWKAWKASREAIRLPTPHLEFDGDPAPEMFASEVYAAVGVKPKC